MSTTTAPNARVMDGSVIDRPVTGRSRRVLRPLLMIGGIVAVGLGSLTYWLNAGCWVDIDDAYVQAAKESIATDVSGLVAEVPVHEGQLVHKGEVLLRLDPRQFRIALEGARANLKATEQTLEGMKRDYRRMLRDVEAKSAQVQNDEASYQRYANLVKSGGVTRADYDNARFTLAADQQTLESLRTQAEVQLAKIGGNADVDVKDMAQYRQAAAQVDEAQRQLDHSIIYAPFTGIVTHVDTVQPGMYLAASTAAFGIVSTERVWVEANPKETELTYVRPGDHVDVSVDTYPGRSWDGVVESVAPNAGSEFSILPPQNTSGNWVKVVQRIPVRIVVEMHEGDPPLRSGMSVEADIDTGHHRTLADLF
jgi:membrane fusion protein, multidrug efflux system